MIAPRMVPLGDAAVLVELADSFDATATATVGAACDALEGDARFLEVVPAYTSVAVFYEPLDFGGDSAYESVCEAIESLLRGVAPRKQAVARIVEIPVRYGGADGPDLAVVATHSGLDAVEVVRRHAAAEYTVCVIGFAPGFPYLAGMPPELATPRRAAPRERVPAGSVGIAGEQTGIYPLETPGGWNLIGRTDTALFTPSQDSPTLLRVGDRVRFVPLA